MIVHIDPAKRCCVADMRDNLSEDEAKQWTSLGPCDIIQRESKKNRRARAKGAKSYDREGVAENKDGEFMITPSGQTIVYSCANHAMFVANELAEADKTLMNMRGSKLNTAESPKTEDRFEDLRNTQNERAINSLSRATNRRLVNNKNRARSRNVDETNVKPVNLPSRVRSNATTYFSPEEMAPTHDIVTPKVKTKFNSEESTTPTAETPVKNKRTRSNPQAPTPTSAPAPEPTVRAPKPRVQRMFDVNDLEEEE
jgi:hypothetical protein